MNNTFAIHAAVPAIPAKPKMPAIIAITRNIMAHDNIFLTSWMVFGRLSLRVVGCPGVCCGACSPL